MEGRMAASDFLLILLLVFPERCQSGRTSKPGKFVYGKPYRGFESHPLRKSKPPRCKRGFLFGAEPLQIHLHKVRRTKKRPEGLVRFLAAPLSGIMTGGSNPPSPQIKKKPR